MKRQNKVWLLILMVLVLACNEKTVRPKPDISNISVQLEAKRFEKDLFASKGMPSALESLQKQYPEFYPVYMQSIMRLTRANDTIIRQAKAISAFINNPYVKGLFDTCAMQYPNIDAEVTEIAQAIKYFKHYFPQKKTPQKIISYISEFSLAAMTIDASILGIGLDMYLGTGYKYYPSIGFPQFMIKKLTRENIVPNVMRAMILNSFEYEDKPTKNLLEEMIQRGKTSYLLSLLMPEADMALLLGYSKKSLSWLESNEAEVWTYFIKNDLLYSTNRSEFTKFVNDGPTTPGMPKNAPGNIGSWIGYKIVSKIATQKDISLLQLLENTNAQEILSKSKYKPKR